MPQRTVLWYVLGNSSPTKVRQEPPSTSEICRGVGRCALIVSVRTLPGFLVQQAATGMHGWFVLLIACAACLPTYSLAQQRTSIEQTPRAVREGSAQLIGHYDSNQMLRLVFALKPPHLEEEEQFLNQLQDKDSPLFHKYLSEKEWNERFAPSAQDEQAVVAWAQSQGLTITQRFPNRLLVDVEAPVAIIEKALDVAINRYQLKQASYYSNDRDPAIPASLAGTVHAVLGLNNLEVMHAASRNIKEMPALTTHPGRLTRWGRTCKRRRPKAEAATSAAAKQLQTYWVYWPQVLWGATTTTTGETSRFTAEGSGIWATAAIH